MMHSNCRILDVGCSYGDNGVYFKENLNAILWGFEFDAASIEKARKTQVYEAVHEMDLNLFTPHNWAAYYGYFDYVFVGDVLEHLQDPSVVLSKLKHFLKDSGAIVVSVPNIKHADVVLDLLDAHFSYYNIGILDKTHIKFFTWKSLARLFTDAHLQVVDAVPTFTLPGEMKGFVHSKALPKSLYSFVSTDRHSFVLQYVCKLEPSNEISEMTFTKCMNILASSVYNNPEEYTPREHAIANFTHQNSTDFSSGDWKCVFENSIKTKTLGDAILASGLFDANWYANAYPCATYANRHPLFHYIELGWQLGWNPSEIFDTNWYLHEYADALANHQCPLLHYVEKGIFEDCFVSETAKQQYEEQNKFYSPSKDDLQTTSSLYLPIIESSFSGQFDTRLIAFYLPQYYPFELNNKYWGEGFTDWRNVASARPLFDGHYQPHIPIDTGHYDLRLEENALRQFELAKMYGVHAFCYYYYWFDGKRLMDMPVYRHLANAHFDFPYCLCWAPETWRTTWHNTESRIMLEQQPTIDAKRFFCDIRPFMQDERYIRVNGKPLLMIYHPTFFEKSVLIQFLETFRELAMKQGVGDLHVVFAKSYVQQAQYTTPEDLGGDAFADFPPHGATFPLDKAVKFYSPSRNDVHQVFDMRIVAEKMGLQPHYAYSHYPTVMPMWDNTARAVHSRTWTFVHASPDLYQQWLENAIRYVAEYKTRDDRIVFINAWNEWAEGAHLEPDMRYGYAFLNATLQALENSRVSR